MRAGLFSLLLSSLICLPACSEEPPARVVEDSYSRVVTLAPNLTELVYAVGAGAKLVGVSAYSDYPPEALNLPVVGDAFMVDQERLATLQPDLLLAWQSGTPAHVVDELRRAGYTVEVVRTQSLQDVAEALLQIGELTDFVAGAEVVAGKYRQALHTLEEQFADAAAISVFYQVSQRPLFTVNGGHFVSELINLCGGQNIFADLNSLAPAIDVEAVVERDPEVMLASSDAGDDAFDQWQRWPHIAANRYKNHFIMPADAIGRATPRLVDAAQAVCAALSDAREHRFAMQY